MGDECLHPSPLRKDYEVPLPMDGTIDNFVVVSQKTDEQNGLAVAPRGHFGTPTRNLFFRRESLCAVELSDHALPYLKASRLTFFVPMKTFMVNL